MEQSYKEKYEDILARLAKAKNDNDVCDERFCCVIDGLIPELAESEDEKIRKRLITDFGTIGKKEWGGLEVKDILAWLENIPYTIDHEKREGFHLGYKACLEKQGEQKPAEFDDANAKRMFIKALERVEEQNNKGYKLTDCDKNSWWEDFKAYTTSKQILANSAKTCKDEQKPAWSVEDEQHIDSLLKRLDALCRNKFERTRFAISEDRDWLKSLRPQNHWKPSDEQMEALTETVHNLWGSPATTLNELLADLRKLKKGE